MEKPRLPVDKGCELLRKKKVSEDTDKVCLTQSNMVQRHVLTSIQVTFVCGNNMAFTNPSL
jgi:IS1 family transposase